MHPDSIRRAIAAALTVILLTTLSVAAQAASADIVLGPDVAYWPRSSTPDVAQSRGDVEVRVTWLGVADAASIPAAVRALDVTDARTYVGIRLRIENDTKNDATISTTDGGLIFDATQAQLTTNLGEIRVRDAGSARGRTEIPAGTYRTYDLVFLTDQPASDIGSVTLSMPRLRGVRWAPIGDTDYRLVAPLSA